MQVKQHKNRQINGVAPIPLFRRRHRPRGIDFLADHYTGSSAGQNQDRRGLAGHHVDSVRRHRAEQHRHDRQRRRAPFRQGIRADSLCLFDRPASRAGLLRFVQARRADAGLLRRGHRAAGRSDRLYPAYSHRNPDSHDGGHSFGRRDQHARTGCGPAGLCRRNGG